MSLHLRIVASGTNARPNRDKHAAQLRELRPISSKNFQIVTADAYQSNIECLDATPFSAGPVSSRQRIRSLPALPFSTTKILLINLRSQPIGLCRNQRRKDAFVIRRLRSSAVLSTMP